MLKNRWLGSDWVVLHTPGPSIFPKGHLWMDKILQQVKAMGKRLFVGIYKGIIIPWFLRWCEMDFVRPQYGGGSPKLSPRRGQLARSGLGGHGDDHQHALCRCLAADGERAGGCSNTCTGTPRSYTTYKTFVP